MPSLMLVVFALQVIIHLINTVGAPVIDDFLWNIFQKLPISKSGDSNGQTNLRRELVKLKRELNATSSQDEFAKWAKLRRNHDKMQAQYDEMTKKAKDNRTSFDRTVTTLRFLSTNGLRFFLQFWYAKRAMFWIPRGWVPGLVEWMLAFPRAPRGSISIQIWGIACATVVQMVGSAAVAGYILYIREKTGTQKLGEPMKMSGGVSEPAKKEL